MSITYTHTTEQISGRLSEYGLPADVVYAITSAVTQQRNVFDEALRMARNVEKHGTAIADCALYNCVFSTEDLAVAVDDLAHLSGKAQMARSVVEQILTVAQHLIGEHGHLFTMEMSAMIWS